MSTNVSAPTMLRVSRLIKAPRERVFAAWTSPDEISKWFGCGPSKVVGVTADVKVGGEYSIRVGGGDCQTGKDTGEREVRGKYVEVKKPSRLVYTWSWSNIPDLGETLVTVDFVDREGFTDVQITHELLPTAEWRDRHGYGWNAGLDKLQELMAGK
jgi:glutathione S-transferase